MGKAKEQRRKAGTKSSGTYSKFRTRWRHVLRIDQRIRSGKAPTCRDLADELEVSRRTILRDIDFLRFDLGAPVEYNAQQGGYVYTEPNWDIPSVRITEGELFALMVAEKALEAYEGTPWAKRLAQVFDRMVTSLPDRIEIAPRDLLARVSFSPNAVAIVDPKTVSTIAEAVSANRVLKMVYLGLGRTEPKQYVLDPYMLRRASGAWYLVGKDHSSGRVPLFNLSRVQKVQPTAETFDYEATGFDPKAYFASSFGVYEASTRYRIVVEFSGWAARLVRERRWHPSQEFKDLPDGRLRFEADASHLDDVWPWVLSWGAEAKVIEPKELAEIVGQQVSELAKQYRVRKS